MMRSDMVWMTFNRMKFSRRKPTRCSRRLYGTEMILLVCGIERRYREAFDCMKRSSRNQCHVKGALWK
ncbi:hypothetical protein DPMN_155464 [Dreissena polymorpha]|uniref:Uncharacterized protein n=1 Tax=Dreissena polymorpha TaxID=45954 RepID=A0A9D4JBE0_DREPO|nr:hypothetical protein DPMN_155464 [Dreissena polymorpha]